MRVFATALAASIAVMGFVGDASALNDTDSVVVNNPAFDSTCSLLVPRPDTATGDSRSPRECSCVLVGPQEILTNSSCLNVNVEDADPPLVEGIEVRFESGGTIYEVDDIALYRYYDAELSSVDGLAGAGFTEFALAHLTADPGITPAIVNSDPLLNFENTQVQILGFGVSSGGGSDFGTKKGIEIGARNLQFTHFFAGSETSTTCPGDHGAPVFGMVGGETRLVAITAFDILERCFENINRMRVDRIADEFISPYVKRFEGSGCVNPNDPDCECGWQGGGDSDCETGCGTSDFDCPLGSLPGFGCTDADDCEFGAGCVAAEDDPTFSYCSNVCDANGMSAPASCANGMSCESGQCKYGIPSRGSQGFACASNSDCRSDICEGEICVFECSGPSDCSGDFECLQSNVASGVNVCRLPDLGGGGGFCSVRAPGSDDGVPVTLAAFALALVIAGGTLRRRKR